MPITIKMMLADWISNIKSRMHLLVGSTPYTPKLISSKENYWKYHRGIKSY